MIEELPVVPDKVKVPVAVIFAKLRFPENRAFPWTDNN
jgi:hypothetical protein